MTLKDFSSLRPGTVFCMVISMGKKCVLARSENCLSIKNVIPKEACIRTYEPPCIYIYIYIYICNELIEETARRRKLKVSASRVAQASEARLYMEICP